MTTLVAASWSIFLTLLVASGSSQQPSESPSTEHASLLELVGGRAGRAEKMLEAFKGGFTPEVKDVTGELIEMIEEDMESAVKKDFTQSQAAFNAKTDQFDNFTQKAWNTYQRAIVKDTNYVTCVGQEKELADNHSACTDSSGIKASTRATDCESSNSSKSRSYELTMPDFTCDFHNDDDCTTTWNLFASQARGKLSAIKSSASGDNAAFEDDFADCEAAAQAEKDQQAKCSGTESAWSTKMAECAGKNTERVSSICAFANNWQKRCMAYWELGFIYTNVSVPGKNQTSESDRQKEWSTISSLKCMLQKLIDTDNWNEATFANCTAKPDTYSDSVGVFDWRDSTIDSAMAYNFSNLAPYYGCGYMYEGPFSLHDFSTQSWTIQPESIASRTIDGTVYTLNNDVEYNIDRRMENAPLDICE